MKKNHPHIISNDDFLKQMKRRKHGKRQCYYSMYSSWIDGIVLDPELMVVPVDDHVVHRGDGVFETLKCVDGALYNMKAHLIRLANSADVIALDLPEPMEQIGNLVISTVRAGKRENCTVRIIISRGPGSLGVNPGDSPQSQLYIIAAESPEPFMISHPDGASAGISAIPAKQSPLASVKTCNYLPNALMKRESVDRGLDFVFALDEDGCICEGSIENVAMVDPDGFLLTPSGDRLLEGTTLKRVLELLDAGGNKGILKGHEKRSLSVEDFIHAREIMVFGTTIDVTAVTEFEGRPVGNKIPGPAFSMLSEYLHKDILTNPDIRTPIV